MDYQLEIVNLQALPPAQHILSVREQAFFSTLKLPKRQTEWLGGRLALKRVVSSWKKLPLKSIEILPQESSGKPQLLVEGEKSPLAFSITHSNGYAVAALAPRVPCLGIDLEQIAPRINAWKQDFFHPSELTADTDEFLTSLWTQKEALVKMLGTGLAINSHEVRIVNKVPQFLNRALQIYQSLGSPAVQIDTLGLIPGFCFSVAVGK